MRENVIIAITSKIVSLNEGALVARTCPPGTPEARVEKINLIKKEADLYLAEPVYQVSLTVKHGNLILFAGIDESNSKGQSYILFPKNPYASAAKIGQVLRAHY